MLLTVAMLRSVCAGLMDFGVSPLLGEAAAVLGLVLAALAFYAGVAFLKEDVSGTISRMTFRTGKAKQAMESSLREQTDELTREVGVRKQL